MRQRFQPNSNATESAWPNPQPAGLGRRAGWVALGVALSLLAASIGATAQDRPSARNALAVALANQDSNAVSRIVSELRKALGDQAGVPDTRETFWPIPENAPKLSRAETPAAFKLCLTKIEKSKWWRIGLDPAKLEHALREPASILSGCIRANRAGLAGSETCLALAREAGDFLLWTQDQAGIGAFPFPAARGVTRDNAFRSAERYLAQAEKEGRLANIVHNGWIVNDAGDGGLQFDNGEAGIAMFELYEATGNQRYLASAIKAADWAASRPLVPNWNYNSFSVCLLAKAFQVTKENQYLTEATRKALIGVIPGQLKDGHNAGRWLDGHNARAPYHYILLRGLTQLAAVMPETDPARAEVLRALRAGLKARNRDFLERGAPNKDKAMEVLLMVNRVFAADQGFLAETQSDKALECLARLVSDEYRKGKLPLAPREWGMFLEFTMGEPKPN